jgi:hypothetical protein
MEATTKRVQAVYAIVAKPDGREFFMRVGSAFANRDGSTNLLLDAFPTSGRLQIRDYQPREGADAQHERARRAEVV